MRVLHVVTLVAADGIAGGPMRVAFNLANEIQRRGHRVLVIGCVRGYDPVPTTVDSVPVRLFRPRQLPFAGFVGMFAPGMLAFMWKHRHEFDVIHVHMGRDMVTLPAAALALLSRKRVVLQTHGMVDVSDHPLAPLLDRLATTRVLRHADAVLYLTEFECRQLVEVAGHIRTRKLLNGVPVPPAPARRRDASAGLRVLFLARIQQRKRPTLFVEAAGELLREKVDASFVLFGPDGGEGPEVTRAISQLGELSAKVSWEGALSPEQTLAEMRKSDIYVLPSVDEPFPMSVLEAMSVGLPVIVTDTCGLADALRRSGSGIVVDESKEELVAAMRRLLVDPALRDEMGRAARATAEHEFGMRAVGDSLLSAYDQGRLQGRTHSAV